MTPELHRRGKVISVWVFWTSKPRVQTAQGAADAAVEKKKKQNQKNPQTELGVRVEIKPDQTWWLLISVSDHMARPAGQTVHGCLLGLSVVL